MAKLQVPVVDGSSSLQAANPVQVASQVASGAELGRIQRTAGADAIAGAAKIGAEQQNFGNWMAAQGNEDLARSMKAMNQAMYNIVQSNAVKDYNDATSSELGDTQSQPSFGRSGYMKASKFKNPQAMEKSMDATANEINKKYAPGVEDPELRAKFTQSLGELNNNRKLAARQVQRATEMDVADKSLQQALNTDIQSGLMDSSENLGYYAAQGLDRIKNALAVGSISQDQALKYGENLRKGLYFGSLQVMNQKDPNMVSQLLSTKSASDLNLNDLEYDKLKKQNQFALQDVNTLNKIQYKTQVEIDSAKRAMNSGLLKNQIKDGLAHSAQIVEAFDKGKIDFKQYSQLANYYVDAQDKIEKSLKSKNNISASLMAGDFLSAYSPEQIDDHYQNRLKLISPNGDGKVDMATKVEVASMYKAPIKSLNKEIEWGINSGDIESIKNSIYAYNKLSNENPLAVSDIKDKKMQAYIAALSNAYKYTDNLTKDNIQKIKSSIYDVDGRTLKKRENDFADQSDFSDNNIKKTISNMYEGGNPWYRSSDYVDNNIVDMVKPLLRDAYRETGNTEDAIRSVANQTKFLMGHSEINKFPDKWGLPGTEAGTIMALPPEKVYGDKATPDQLRYIINKEVTPLIPKDMDPNKVMIGSDELTVEQFRNKLNPSYYLYYKDTDGNEVLLPQRWSFDNNSMQMLKDKQAADMQVNVAGGARIPAPNVVDNKQPVGQPVPAENKHQAIMKAVLSSTKPGRDTSILQPEFIDSMAKSAYIPELSSKYPGDKQSQPVVQSAIEKMVGPDQDSWRVGQSLKLINSVLTNNSDLKTYMKYGVSTDNPSVGDIVISNTKAGLFDGFVNMNGRMAVKFVSMEGKGLAPDIVPLSAIKDFRTLPTPEEFNKQSEPVTISRNAPGFNPYTGGPARIAQPTDKWDIYGMTSRIATEAEKNNPNRPKVYDVNSNSMLPIDASIEEKIKAMSVGNKENQQQSNTPTPTTNSTVQVPVENTLPKMSKEDLITKLSTDQNLSIDVGNGQSVTPGELISKLNFGKLLAGPEKDAIVISNGQVGKYIGLDPEDSNRVKIKVGKKTISILKRDIQEYRKMPNDSEYKNIMNSIQMLLNGQVTLDQLMKEGK